MSILLCYDGGRDRHRNHNLKLYNFFSKNKSFIYLFIYFNILILLEYSWFTMVLVSGVQKSDSVIHKHIFIIFWILFSYRLPQYIG